MVVYIASRLPLPLVPFRQDAPGFNVTELEEYEQPVRQHFTVPHIVQAGSHTSCGCGFNEGRGHPEAYDDPTAERADALRSSAQLAQYVREHHVEQIFSCWSGDESEPPEFERRITPDDLVAEDFFFREGELFSVHHKTT